MPESKTGVRGCFRNTSLAAISGSGAGLRAGAEKTDGGSAHTATAAGPRSRYTIRMHTSKRTKASMARAFWAWGSAQPSRQR